MFHDKFIYKKTQVLRDSHTVYYWYLIHKTLRNGVHFHGVRTHDLDEYFKSSFCDNKFGFNTSGIESHSKTQTYEGQTPIDYCEVTGGECFCDGTSLYASENLGHVNPDFCDEEVWFHLHKLYSNWHEKGER